MTAPEVKQGVKFKAGKFPGTFWKTDKPFQFSSKMFSKLLNNGLFWELDFHDNARVNKYLAII